MKKYYILFILSMPFGGHAQIVNIPDPVFKIQRVEHIPVIDTNGDGEIQVSEIMF